MRKKEFWKEKQLYILSFLLPVIMMLLIFMIRRIYPFGDRSFLNIDMYHQYFPFLTEFFDKIKSGESLLYSFRTGIGTNFVDLYAYYLASPTNWLVALFPREHIMEFMSYMTILKIGGCSLTFVYYARRHFHTKHMSLLFFGLAYAFSGYLAAYNWNVMWLDLIILAPLVFLGLERLVQEGNAKLYCITLALSILTNYYLSIMLCIFVTLYFVVLVISSDKKEKQLRFGRTFLRFALFSLLAAGIACVLLLPAFEMLRQSAYSDSNFPSKINTYFPIFDVFARHFANISIETGLDHWPNIYCGVFVMFLLPLYVMNKNIPLKEKAPKLLLLLFCIVSFSNNVLTFLWHGFNYPNSLPSRQSFLYILLLLMVCLEAFLHLKEYSKPLLIKVGAGIALFLLLCQKLVTDDAFTFDSYLVTFLALSAYAILLYFAKEKQLKPKFLYLLTLLVVVTELGANMLITSVSTVSRTNYLADYDSYKQLITRCQERDTDFYRIEKEDKTTKNDAMFIGYPSTSLFSSTTNSYINNFYEKYGMSSSKVFYCDLGATPFMSALLSNRYFLSNEPKDQSSLYELVDTEGNISLYQNNYSLPMGFMTSADLEAIPTAADPILQQNELAALLGSEEKLYEEINVINDSNTDTFTVTTSSYVYAYPNGAKIKEATATINGKEQKFEKLKNPYILDLGYVEAGTEVTVTTPDDVTLNLTAYSMNEEVLRDLLADLESESFVVDTHSSNKISGHINVTSEKLLTLSIPYEPNWTVMVDGAKVETFAFQDMFLSIPLEAGEHTISLSYHTKSLNVGGIVSILSVLIFVSFCVYTKRSSVKKESVKH